MTITDWLKANIDPLRTIDPETTDYEQLQPLREIIGDARVVAIGESTHRVHEFYQIRHLLTRFLVDELGFTVFVMESGFAEGWAVNDWVLGGDGDLDELLRTGITYHMGRCTEMRDQLTWMREHNRARDRKIRFYGMDIPTPAHPPAPQCRRPSRSWTRPIRPTRQRSANACSPSSTTCPPTRTGLAWSAPAIQAYLALDTTHRNELTARINELAERLHALRVPYSTVDPDRADIALRCAITARHADAFLANIANAAHRTYRGANVRDAAMAENVEWILGREERIVIGAANGHVQRWPYRVPPIINEDQVMLGQHLARSLGEELVVIATTYNGGRMFLHRPIPGGPPGHTEIFFEEVAPFTERNSLDVVMAGACEPLAVLDLHKVPDSDPIADRFAAIDGTMQGEYKQLVNPLAAFDAVVHIDKVSPWKNTLSTA